MTQFMLSTTPALPNEILADWPAVKQRWLAWWAHDLYDRPLLQIRAPWGGTAPADAQSGPGDAVDRCGYMVRRAEEDLRCTYYGGEALPLCWNPISAGWAFPSVCGPFFRCDGLPRPGAGWPGRFPGPRWRRESRWWPWIWDGQRQMARASRGRFFVPPFWAAATWTFWAWCAGSSGSWVDFVENRAWLAGALRQMNGILYTIYDELWPHLGEAVTGLEGNIDSSGFWSPGRSRTFDADLAYSISPRDFRELILPPLVEWMQRIDYSSWHLHGIGNFRHLDTLLDVPELQAIQWVQGEGAYHAILQWIPLLRKVQARGKSLQVLCEPHEVLPVLKELQPEGLVISTTCATQGEARALIETVARMYR